MSKMGSFVIAMNYIASLTAYKLAENGIFRAQFGHIFHLMVPPEFQSFDDLQIESAKKEGY